MYHYGENVHLIRSRQCASSARRTHLVSSHFHLRRGLSRSKLCAWCVTRKTAKLRPADQPELYVKRTSRCSLRTTSSRLGSRGKMHNLTNQTAGKKPKRDINERWRLQRHNYFVNVMTQHDYAGQNVVATQTKTLGRVWKERCQLKTHQIPFSPVEDENSLKLSICIEFRVPTQFIHFLFFKYFYPRKYLDIQRSS